MIRSLLLSLLFIAAAPGAAAQSDQSDLQEAERLLQSRAEEEKRLRREAAARNKEVAALRHRLIETANSLQEAEREITRLENSITELEAEKVKHNWRSRLKAEI